MSALRKILTVTGNAADTGGRRVFPARVEVVVRWQSRVGAGNIDQILLSRAEAVRLANMLDTFITKGEDQVEQ